MRPMPPVVLRPAIIFQPAPAGRSDRRRGRAAEASREGRAALPRSGGAAPPWPRSSPELGVCRQKRRTPANGLPALTACSPAPAGGGPRGRRRKAVLPFVSVVSGQKRSRRECAHGGSLARAPPARARAARCPEPGFCRLCRLCRVRKAKQGGACARAIGARRSGQPPYRRFRRWRVWLDDPSERADATPAFGTAHLTALPALTASAYPERRDRPRRLRARSLGYAVRGARAPAIGRTVSPCAGAGRSQNAAQASIRRRRFSSMSPRR